MSGRDKHSSAVDHLLFHPEKIGIADLVRWSAKELNVFRTGTRELLTQIDLLYRTESGVYVAEYKGGKSGNERRAEEQLEEAASFVKKEFGQVPVKIYVRGETFHYETWS